MCDLIHGEIPLVGNGLSPCGSKSNCKFCRLYKPIRNTLYKFGNKEFEKDFAKMSYKDLVKKYRNTFRNYEHSTYPEADEDTPIIKLPTGFYEVTNHKCRSSKIKVSNWLRLDANLTIRRLICPTLSFDECIYALCYEMAYYVKNTDENDFITRQGLIMIAENAMNDDPSQMEYERPRETIVNLKYVLKNNVIKT